MPFGQLVIGPPGSGKTVYCDGMNQFLTALGRCVGFTSLQLICLIHKNEHRQVCVINLDPANDGLPYPCSINISELISLQHVVDESDLGPNGGP